MTPKLSRRHHTRGTTGSARPYYLYAVATHSGRGPPIAPSTPAGALSAPGARSWLPQPAAAKQGKVSIMPDTKPPTTELTSQYVAQVASDLERKAKEQERIGAEIDALQEQLRALQHDH